jgi:hypothetical protein
MGLPAAGAPLGERRGVPYRGWSPCSGRVEPRPGPFRKKRPFGPPRPARSAHLPGPPVARVGPGLPARRHQVISTRISIRSSDDHRQLDIARSVGGRGCSAYVEPASRSVVSVVLTVIEDFAKIISEAWVFHGCGAIANRPGSRCWTVMVLHWGDDLINRCRRESTPRVGPRVPVALSTVSDDCSV